MHAATEEQLGAQQAALEAAARQLGNPEGGVRYWTDYLKVRSELAWSAPCLHSPYH